MRTYRNARWFCCGLVAAMALADNHPAWALTMDVPVTPTYVQEHAKEFSVLAEKRADGLIHFTIHFTVSRPSYLVANTAVKQDGKVVYENTAAAYVRESTSDYFLTLSPEHITDATFELFHGSYSDAGGQPVALVGGTNYQFALAEFSKNVLEVKAH